MISESLSVTASSGKKTSDIKVKDMRELTRIAKTGQYDHFLVQKRNGSEEEYMVDNGRLVLL